MSNVKPVEVEQSAAPQKIIGAPESPQACLNLHDIEVSLDSHCGLRVWSVLN
jgi:hypothetical protein